MELEIEALERATLDAVAPPIVLTWPDWLLPMDHSTIGRAISAVPLRHSDLSIGALAEIETLYVQSGHQPRFRFPDRPKLSNFQEALRTRGYLPTQATLTRVTDLQSLAEAVVGLDIQSVQLSSSADPAWKSVYGAPCFDPVDGAHRVAALSRSPHIVYAWVQGSQGSQGLQGLQGSVAAGTASLSHGWLGLHGMRTLISERGQGHAKKLIGELAKLGLARGYRQAYLQVEESNEAANALYQRLGFRTAWRYHYWVLGQGGQTRR